MADIITLTIPYDDFQLNEVVDPEQFDANNSAIVNKINEVIAEYNAEVKTLGSTSTGDSGALKIGLEAIDGLTSDNLQAVIAEIKAILDSNDLTNVYTKQETRDYVASVQMSAFSKIERLKIGDPLFYNKSHIDYNVDGDINTITYSMEEVQVGQEDYFYDENYDLQFIETQVTDGVTTEYRETTIFMYDESGNLIDTDSATGYTEIIYNLFDIGVDHANVTVTGAGCTKDADKVYLLQGTEDNASLPISELKTETTYTIFLDLNNSTIEGTGLKTTADSFCDVVTIGKTTGINKFVVTTPADLTGIEKLDLEIVSSSDAGQGIEIKYIALLEGDRTDLTITSTQEHRWNIL